MSSTHFRLEGEFQGFAPGKKSPFKYLRVKTATEEVRIKLKKSLRVMLFRYLVPGDWVRVVGQQIKYGRQDAISLKAEDVIRIPSFPREEIPSLELHGILTGAGDHICKSPSASSSKSPSKSPGQSSGKSSGQSSGKSSDKLKGNPSDKSKVQSSRILICKKSKCRKRGGDAVGESVERSLSELGLSDQVSVKYTGCMDRCKAGPNMVFMPGKVKYTRVKPGKVPDLIQNHYANPSPDS
ncbi:MAG: (2Fe-2S) ferredoxin domain-containing protein [Cyanobacteria bacterium P01_F01_bin.150]